MASPNAVRNAQRASNIVALLEHKPGPGIYSRLERAVQQLPENVRVQELPGLLKRYKDGIPGWELKAVDLDSVVAGRTTVPRDELLDAVRERSPVFTTREVRLSENEPPVPLQPRQKTPDHILLPAIEALSNAENLGFDSPQEALATVRAYPDWRNRWEMTDEEAVPVYRYLEYQQQLQADRAAPRADIGGIGSETPIGITRFGDYKPEGAKNYTELVFLENSAAPDGSPPPVAWMPNIPHHWHKEYPQPWGAPQDVKNATTRDAVAHMRFAEQGDALRLLESQSDAHNRNIKAAKSGAEARPYALEQAQSELDVKRLLLEAARQGKSAVEIASPEFVSETVGMPLEHAQHRYGKVLPSEMERAGRKLGGFSETERPATVVASGVASSPTDRWRVLKDQADAVRMRSLETQQLIRDLVERRALRGIGDAALPDVPLAVRRELDRSMQTIGWLPTGAEALLPSQAKDLRTAVASYIGSRLGNRSSIIDNFAQADQIMPEVMKHIEDMRELSNSYDRLNEQSTQAFNQARQQGPAPGWRGVISDEMRKRIINEGIPAAIAIGVGTGLATGGSEAEAKPVAFGRAAGGFVESPMMPNGLRQPGPTEEQLIRSLIGKGERRQISQLTAQLEDAYATGDFRRAEDLDAKREQLLEDIDNRIAQTTEDTEADFSDFEPNDYEGAASNYEEQMRDIYASYVAGGPHYQNEAELADALRGIGPDTEKASKISDEDIIREAKAAFDKRQAHLEKLRSASPEDGVRAMQARLRDMGAAAFPAPIMAQAQSVNERRELPTGSGGTTADLVRGLVGENDFSMAISPAEWQAHAQRLQTDGMSMEQQKFQQNVTEVLSQPIIRIGAAKDARLLVDGDDFDRMTPAQFVGEYLDSFKRKMDPEARGQVMDKVAARLSGVDQTPDPVVDDIVGRMMGALKESSPKGKYAKADPMPQEQFDALKQQYGQWAESMLTPGSAENFEALRGYELLRTTLDGQHAPVYADNLSNAMTFASGLVDGDSRRDFHELTFSPGPEGRFGRANRDYFRSRTREGEPAAFRDQDGTSRFASTGMNNITGLMRAGGDMSTTVGAISHPLYDSFADFSRTGLGQFLGGQSVDPSDWEFQQSRRQAFDREQSIIPAGMSKEMFDRQQQNHQKDRDEGLAWGATTYPNVQQFFDNVTGSKTQKTWGPPAYNDYGPNFFQNTVGNIPSAGIMAASAATGGVAGLAAGAFKPAGSTVRSLVNAGMGLGRGAAKGVGAAAASQAADLPFDTATDLGIGSTLAGPGNYFSYMATPEKDNALLPGVDPNSMSIEQLNQKRAAALENRNERFLDDKFEWNKKRKTPQEQAYDQWRQS